MMEPAQADQRKPLGALNFSLLSAVVGVVAGFGAVAFRGLIAIIHNALFRGQMSWVYDANQHTLASPWGALIILVPVIGAVVVVFLVKNFAPEAKGHGVPEVMDAVYYNKGIIRPVVAVVKSLASALSIGTGGSVGREGPMIQIGSSFGSTLGQLLKVPAWQRIALIAGGAGGGLAATFNTPVSGILFALEILMHEVSSRTLVPVAIATCMATYVGRLCLGSSPSFVIPALETPYFHVTHPIVLFAYVGLGIVMGAVATLFIKVLYACEDLFDKLFKKNYYLMHMTAMLIVGVTMYAMMVGYGHYYIEGVGYSTLQDILAGIQMPVTLLLLLFVLKLVATSLTLGSGASGGVFSPSLYFGAATGGAYGLLLGRLFPSLGISAPAFAVAGMAAVVGGATGAALAAIVMIFEMTLDYNVIVPMTITVAVSYGVRRALCPESIYTMKLARRGRFVPGALHTDYHFVKRASEFMEASLVRLRADDTLDMCIAEIAALPPAGCAIVIDGDRIGGYIHKDDAVAPLENAAHTITMRKLARLDYITVSPSTPIFEVVDKMHASAAFVALVTDSPGADSPAGVKGVLSRQRLADVMIQTAELFED